MLSKEKQEHVDKILGRIDKRMIEIVRKQDIIYEDLCKIQRILYRNDNSRKEQTNGKSQRPYRPTVKRDLGTCREVNGNRSNKGV